MIYQYQLVIIPPNGDVRVIDPRCEGHSEVNSNGRTFFEFHANGEVILSATVGQEFSWTLMRTLVSGS